ncbi:MAG: hypothetical protein WC761_03520 [Candidatus Paceibacterota bacterium]|jgi:hypothetical protein
MQDLNAIPSDPTRHGHFKYKICVSGAADMTHLPPEVHEAGKALGAAIANRGAITVTGATTGFPIWAALGAKRAGGISFGLSPASSEREHVEAYKLPLDYLDLIIYTGFGYPGRDLFLTRASDAVVIGPGRIGTFHEFTIAYEDNKPLGILESDLWETDEILHEILAKSNRSTENIIFDKDPDRLVERVIEMVKKKKINDFSRM